MPVWYGIGVGNWLRLLAMRPPIDVSRWPRVAGITAASVANSLLHLVEKSVHGRRVEQATVSMPPLFILGHWRSGTTLLHNLLALDRRFVAPTQYQVSFPGHFLLTERWLPRLLKDTLPERRPMDAMALGWNTPGEDEIALLLLTLASPYLRAAFPSGGATVDHFDDLRRNLTANELAQWKTTYLRFLKKVTLSRPGTLLLKSPAHTGRIPLLLEIFPDAKFVYLVRNPYDVVASTCHLERVLSDANGLTRSTPTDLEQRAIASYRQLYDAYHLHRALVPSERRCELRFEDLTADPIGSLERLYQQLTLGDFTPMRSTLEARLAYHRSYQKNSYVTDERTREAVSAACRPAFQRYGYACDD